MNNKITKPHGLDADEICYLYSYSVSTGFWQGSLKCLAHFEETFAGFPKIHYDFHIYIHKN